MFWMRLKLAARGSKSSVGRTAASAVEPGLDVGQSAATGGQHRVHFVVLEAANLAEVILDAIEQKLAQLALSQIVELVVELRFDQNLDDALRGAAQSERIFRARRHQADGEASAQRIQLVGQRHDLAFVRGWNRALHAERLVMIVDRLRDRLGFALAARKVRRRRPADR